MRSLKFLPSLLLASLISTPALFASSAEFAALQAKASRGNSIAQYNLGLAYAQGQDVPVDLVQAYVWLSLASDRGTTGRALQVVRAKMNSDQLAEAERLLAQQRSGKPACGSTPSSTEGSVKAEKLSFSLSSRTPEASINRESSHTAASETDDSAAASLRQDRQQLADELALAWRDLKKNETNLNAANTELGLLRSRLAVSETRAGDAQAASSQLTALRAQNQALESERTSLSAEKNQALERASRFSSDNADLLVRATKAEATLRAADDANERVSSLSHDLANAQRETAAAQSALAAERARVTDTTSALGAARSRLEEMSAAQVRLQEQLSAQSANADTGRQLAVELETSRRESAGAQEKIAALNTQLSTLTDSANQSDSRLQQLQAEISRAGSEKKQLSEELALAWKENEKAQVDAKTAAIELAASRGQAAQSDRQLAQLQRDLNDARLMATTATAKTTEWETVATTNARTTKDLSAQLTSVRELLEQERAAQSAGSDAAHRLQAELETSHRESAAAKDRIARLSADLSAQTAAAEQAGHQASARTVELAALTQKLTATEKTANQFAANQTRLGELQQQVTGLQSQLTASESRASTAQANVAQLAKLRTQLQSSEDTRTRLVSEKTASATQLSQLTAENQTLHRTLNEQADTAAAQRTQGERATQAFAETRTQMEALRTQLQSTETDRTAIQQQFDRATAEQSAQKRQLDETNGKLSEAVRSYTALQTETEQLKTNASAANEQAALMREKTGFLERQLASDREESARISAASVAEAEAKLTVALRSYQLAQGELDTTKAERARLTEEKAALETQLSDAQRSFPIAAQAQGLREQLRQTQAQSAALSTENARLKTLLVLNAPTTGTKPSAPSDLTAAATKTEIATIATAPKSEVRLHTVAAGDTLTRISSTYYGTPNRWNEILLANGDLVRNERSLVIGRTLRIP